MEIPEKMETLVIGGAGMRGVNLAKALHKENMLEGSLFVDPEDPLEHWNMLVKNIGMTHLRSSSGWGFKGVLRHLKGDSMSVEKLNNQVQKLLEKIEFSKHHLKMSVFGVLGKVKDQVDSRELFNVIVGDVSSQIYHVIKVRNLVCSTGLGDPVFPSWKDLKSIRDELPGMIVHSSELQLLDDYSDKCIGIIGGGQSAYQLAHAITDRNGSVMMVMRSEPEFSSDGLELHEHNFDKAAVETSFFNLDARSFWKQFEKLRGKPRASSSYKDFIDKNPNIDLHVDRDLNHYEPDLSLVAPKGVRIRFDVGSDRLGFFDQIVCCTGFSMETIQKQMVWKDAGYPQYDEGFPTVDKNCMSNVSGLFFMGKSATRRLGAGAPNIGVMQQEAELLVRGLKNRKKY